MTCEAGPRVGIVVGHHPDAGGARFEVEGVSRTEYQIWKPFARELAAGMCSGPITPVVINRPRPRPGVELGRKINRATLDFAFELHFNAVENSDVSGTLMIHRAGHDPSKRLARVFQTNTREVLGLRDRATFGRKDLGIFRHTRSDLPLILCEPAFGSNASDVVTMLAELPDLAKAFRASCFEFDAGG